MICPTSLQLDHQYIYITVEKVTKAVAKVKSQKAAGPSGIVAEMLKSTGITGAYLVTNLANSIIKLGKIPSDWESNYIINLYKRKGDALERGNYHELKLLNHVIQCHLLNHVILIQ